MVPKLLPDNLEKKGNLVKWILRCSVIIHLCSAAVLLFYQGTANKDAKGVEAVWDLIAPIVRSVMCKSGTMGGGALPQPARP